MSRAGDPKPSQAHLNAINTLRNVLFFALYFFFFNADVMSRVSRSALPEFRLASNFATIAVSLNLKVNPNPSSRSQSRSWAPPFSKTIKPKRNVDNYDVAATAPQEHCMPSGNLGIKCPNLVDSNLATGYRNSLVHEAKNHSTKC